jgi:hypothetical protein
MKYIKDTAAGWLLDDYFAYIESCGKMDPATRDFAIDRSRYDLSSHGSLHDAWLDRLSLTEDASGSRHQIRPLGAVLEFLGPYHDRRFRFTYSGVKKYLMAGNAPSNGHGDLLMHEFSLDDRELITHEMIFSSGSSLLLVFERLEFEEQLLEQTE